MRKEYDCNDERMAEYLAEVRKLEKFLDGFEVRYIPQLDNKDMDHMACIVSSRSPIPKDVKLERLASPSIVNSARGFPLLKS